MVKMTSDLDFDNLLKPMKKKYVAPSKPVSKPRSKPKPKIDYLKKIEVLENKIISLESKIIGGQINREFLFEVRLLSELFADKYAQTKKRWKETGCKEVDFLKYTKLKKMLENLV